MDLMLESGPETCRSLGLDCGTCVRRAAATVATICAGVEASGAQQLFFQMYPSPGCRPMAQAFVLAYSEASMPEPAHVLVSEPRVLTFASAAA